MVQGEDDTETARSSTGGDEVGDVEMAGETTAADTISGPTDTRPVEPDTTVEPSEPRSPTERREG